MVKPPAARPTPQRMSKPTHRPQGYASERWVTDPSPWVNRTARMPAPRTRSRYRIPPQKPMWNRLLGLMASLQSLGDGGRSARADPGRRQRHLLAAVGDPPDGHEGGAPDADHSGDLLERGPRQVGQRPLPQACLEAQRLER